MNSDVLVIIPALNEAATIGRVLDTLEEHVPDYDVVVIDDGSTDRTAVEVEQAGRATLIRLPFNMGIGSAVQTGYKYALRHGYAIAVQCDADGQHPIHQMRRLVDQLRLAKADLVIGSRYVASSEYVPSLTRRVGKSMLSRLVDSCIGGGITDTTSGFRAANREAIQLFAGRYPDDYPEAESLVLLYKAGLRAEEIPVDMNARQGGRTSISLLHGLYYMLKVGLAILVGMLRRPVRRGEH